MSAAGFRAPSLDGLSIPLCLRASLLHRPSETEDGYFYVRLFEDQKRYQALQQELCKHYSPLLHDGGGGGSSVVHIVGDPCVLFDNGTWHRGIFLGDQIRLVDLGATVALAGTCSIFELESEFKTEYLCYRCKNYNNTSSSDDGLSAGGRVENLLETEDLLLIVFDTSEIDDEGILQVRTFESVSLTADEILSIKTNERQTNSQSDPIISRHPTDPLHLTGKLLTVECRQFKDLDNFQLSLDKNPSFKAEKDSALMQLGRAMTSFYTQHNGDAELEFEEFAVGKFCAVNLTEHWYRAQVSLLPEEAEDTVVVRLLDFHTENVLSRLSVRKLDAQFGVARFAPLVPLCRVWGVDPEPGAILGLDRYGIDRALFYRYLPDEGKWLVWMLDNDSNTVSVNFKLTVSSAARRSLGAKKAFVNLNKLPIWTECRHVEGWRCQAPAVSDQWMTVNVVHTSEHGNGVRLQVKTQNGHDLTEIESFLNGVSPKFLIGMHAVESAGLACLALHPDRKCLMRACLRVGTNILNIQNNPHKVDVYMVDYGFEMVVNRDTVYFVPDIPLLTDQPPFVYDCSVADRLIDRSEEVGAMFSQFKDEHDRYPVVLMSKPSLLSLSEVSVSTSFSSFPTRQSLCSATPDLLPLHSVRLLTNSHSSLRSYKAFATTLCRYQTMLDRLERQLTTTEVLQREEIVRDTIVIACTDSNRNAPRRAKVLRFEEEDEDQVLVSFIDHGETVKTPSSLLYRMESRSEWRALPAQALHCRLRGLDWDLDPDTEARVEECFDALTRMAAAKLILSASDDAEGRMEDGLDSRLSANLLLVMDDRKKLDVNGILGKLFHGEAVTPFPSACPRTVTTGGVRLEFVQGSRYFFPAPILDPRAASTVLQGAKITAVVSPDHFYLSFKDSAQRRIEMYGRVDEILRDLDERKLLFPLTEFAVGSGCVVHHKRTLRRAEIREERDEHVHVEFVDYGTLSLVPKTDVYRAPLVLFKFPRWAFPCRLVQCEPCASAGGRRLWSERARRRMKDWAEADPDRVFHVRFCVEEQDPTPSQGHYAVCLTIPEPANHKCSAPEPANQRCAATAVVARDGLARFARASLRCRRFYAEPPECRHVPGRPLQGYVQHATSPSKFYVHFMDWARTAAEIAQTLQETVASRLPTNQLRPATPCVAPFENELFRAFILSHSDVDKTCEVVFAEYGNRAIVPDHLIFDTSIQLMEYPRTAVRCSLAGVQSRVLTKETPRWLKPAVNFLLNFTLNKLLQFEIVDKKRWSDNEMEFSVNVTCDGRDLATEMIRNGLALSINS